MESKGGVEKIRSLAGRQVVTTVWGEKGLYQGNLSHAQGGSSGDTSGKGGGGGDFALKKKELAMRFWGERTKVVGRKETRHLRT